MKRSEYLVPAICVNDSKYPWTHAILARIKPIETRTAPVFRQFVGRTVGIIRTGKGAACLVGYATIAEEIVYNDACTFYADAARHLVTGKDGFPFPPGGKKYGYRLENVRPLPVPVILPASTYTGDRSARDLAGIA